MSTATISRAAPVPSGRTSNPQVRPARRAAPLRGPLARPARLVPAPTTRPPGRSTAVRSCRVQSAPGTATWRLTDRGIALVLVLVAMIVVAAVTVVGLTAWQVTATDRPEWSAAVSSGR